MKIGGKYRIHEIGVYAWSKLANELGRRPDEVRATVLAMCEELPDRAADVFRATKAEGLSHPILATLRTKMQARARELHALFEP